MLLLFSAAVGLICGAIFAVLGVARGDAGQLERILALAFFAMAAAGIVGSWAMRSDRKEPRHAPA